jgi:streptogramin lyase
MSSRVKVTLWIVLGLVIVGLGVFAYLIKTGKIKSSADAITTGSTVTTSTQVPNLNSTTTSSQTSFAVEELNNSNGSIVNSFATNRNIQGMVPDGTGNLWVIAMDSPTGVSRLNGVTGKAMNAFIVPSVPKGIATDAAGELWITVTGATKNVLKIHPGSGAILGSYTVGNSPAAITIDKTGNVWVAQDTISSPTNLSAAGFVISELNSATGAVINSFITNRDPRGIVSDGSGNLWVTAMDNPTNISRLNGVTGKAMNAFILPNTPKGIAIDTTGNLWITVAGATKNVLKINPGSGTILGSYTFGSSPAAVTIDKTGNVWVANNSVAANPVITSSAGSGNIEPFGAVEVTKGSNSTFYITPFAGFKISDVKVDGNSVGAVLTYTFNNVIANHTISAGFVKNSANETITVQTPDYGTISPSTISVASGSNQTFTVTPNANFKLVDVKVDNASVGSVSSYTFSNIVANHTISATFTSSVLGLTNVTPGNTSIALSAKITDQSKIPTGYNCFFSLRWPDGHSGVSDTTQVSCGNGTFTGTIQGLTPNTAYTVEAKILAPDGKNYFSLPWTNTKTTS